MKLYAVIFMLLAVSVAAAPDSTEEDKCLNEEYATANCTLPWACRRRAPRRALTASLRVTLADGTCCAQGGYKLPGHGCARLT